MCESKGGFVHNPDLKAYADYLQGKIDGNIDPKSPFCKKKDMAEFNRRKPRLRRIVPGLNGMNHIEPVV